MPRVASLLVILLALAASLTAQSASAPPNLWFILPLPDSSTSGGVVSRVAIRNLPVDDPRQALVLVPGVALRAGEIGIGVLPALSIRGAASEPQVLVDGAPVRLQTFGTQGIGIDANALDAAVVTTGVAPVTVTDAGSGVVAYRTRSGGDKLDADVRWSSDEPFGDAMSVGFNHVTGAAGGPLGERLRFAASATLLGQRSQYRGSGAEDVPVLVPSGIDTTVVGMFSNSVTIPRFVAWDGGVRRPFDWTSARRVHGRLDFDYGTGSALSLTLLASDLQQRVFPERLLLVPNAYQGERATAAIGILNWRHALGTREMAPALSVTLSYARESDVNGALESETEVATRDPYLGIEMRTLRFIGTDVLPSTETLVHNVRTNSGLRTPYLNRADLRFAQPYRTNPYGMQSGGWATQGLDTQLGTSTERRLNGRATLGLRSGTHQMTFGLDIERSTVELYTSRLLAQAFMDVFAEHPSRIGLFGADRISVGGATIDLGVRYDRYAPGGEFPNTPGRIYSNPNWSPNASTDAAAYNASVANVFTKTRTQTFISPRLKVLVPVASKTTFRLSYGRSVEPPAWATFFRQVNADLDFTNAGSVFGRDVSFATTALYEMAAQVEVSPTLHVDAGLFRRDGEQYVSRIQPFPDPLNFGDTINLAALTTVPDKAQWGIDTRLAWRPIGRVNASLGYELARRTIGSGSDFTTHVIAGAALVTLPLEFSGTIFLRASSGDPYTRLLNNGAGTITPSISGSPIEPLNASRLPWTKTIDLRVGKSLRAGGREWQVFADLRNVLNFRNVRALFAETGDVTNDAFRQQNVASEFANLAGEASSNSALETGNTINLTACGTWSDPVNCVALTRVESRFGDGDGHYTTAEQQTALYAFYESIFGAWRFYGAGRTLRVGAQLGL